MLKNRKIHFLIDILWIKAPAKSKNLKSGRISLHRVKSTELFQPMYEFAAKTIAHFIGYSDR